MAISNLLTEKRSKPRGFRRVTVDQWTSGIKTQWSVNQVREALRLHQHGDLSQSAKLVDAMMGDDELPTALDSAVNEIIGAEFTLAPLTDDEEEPIAASKALADQLGPLWNELFPEHEIAKLFSWFFMLGVSIGTLDWDTSVSPWRPHLRTLNPQFLRWNDGEIDHKTNRYGVWEYESRSGVERVTPGDGRWVLLADGRESWMRCAVRALAVTWLVKQYTWRDWARYNERHGLPIVKAMVPAFADGEDKQRFATDIRALGAETSVTLPTHMTEEGAGYDLELLEATDQSYESFERCIQRCDRKFQLHFQGTNSNELIDSAGSRATSESGRSISAQTAKQRERRITTDLRDQLVKPYLMANIPGADLDMAPWPRYSVEGKEDTERRAASLKAFADALNGFKAAGYEVTNLEDEAKKFGLELEKLPEPEPEPMPQDGRPPRQEQEQEQLDAIGKSGGFENGQEYLDRLTESLADEANAIESLSAERMMEVIDGASNAEDLKNALLDEIKDDDAFVSIYQKALILGELSGRYSVTEDL